jgi:hypothetical protein
MITIKTLFLSTYWFNIHGSLSVGLRRLGSQADFSHITQPIERVSGVEKGKITYNSGVLGWGGGGGIHGLPFYHPLCVHRTIDSPQC